MSTANKTPIDKSTWADGPWQHEPDRVEFEHAGLPCLLLRNGSGVWCGYAAVAPGHPLHRADYNDADVSVHGGLTYARACAGEICHVPKPGEPDDVWWFGFDCNHYLDRSPGTEAFFRTRGRPDLVAHDPSAEYRDMRYVRREVESLAEQLAAQR